MDKFCEDCIHNEVCQYGAIPPHIGRCNDKDTLDDLRPQGEMLETKHRLNLLIGVLFSNQVISENDIEYIEDSIKELMKGGAE